MPRKKKSKIYFGKDVQDAIVRYNLSEDDNERNVIYRDEIHRAFDKLAENIINTFKFMYFDVPFRDVKGEVVAFLVMNLHKYDHTKGSKAFSYFSVVAKNYLILHNNNNYKKLKTHIVIDSTDFKESLLHKGENTDMNDLIAEIIKYFESNIQFLFKKKRDIDIAYAIIQLLKSKDEIENYNKKSLYILIREMTDVETTHITKVMNVFRVHYKRILNEFDKFGIVNIDGHVDKFF
tara:strand:- start:9711 stop:10415 length:705 start_codon:yes stop_codon:yes gene_type:complete